MEFDLEDPLACFNELQPCTTISELFASESDHIPSPNCFNSTPFHISFRSEAISIILQVQFSCNLDPFVAYLAINYLHRFMSSQEIPVKPLLLRLVAISCLSLASKMKNTSFSLYNMQVNLQQIHVITIISRKKTCTKNDRHNSIKQKEGCIFEAQSIQKMELLILGALRWRMRSITPFSFLHYFISLAEIKDQSLKQALKERASEIIFNAHYAAELLQYKPSTVAASAVISASHEFLSPQQCSILRDSITACGYVDEETFSKCFELMQEVVRMEAKEYSITDTSFLSTETPVSVLERSIKRRII